MRLNNTHEADVNTLLIYCISFFNSRLAQSYFSCPDTVYTLLYFKTLIKVVTSIEEKRWQKIG